MRSRGVVARVPAKVNLQLSVGPLGSDGFHEVTTVFQAISLFDDVTVATAPDGEGIKISISGQTSSGVPADNSNLAVKAAELMIKNYQNKLAALALVQEGKKGFPQGMPAVAKPMAAENQYSEETFVDPSIKQFASQIDGKLQQVEQVENTEEQDPDFAQQAQRFKFRGDPEAVDARF